MDKSHMTEQILQLTLEILYLLTGEDYAVVSKSTTQTAHNSPSDWPRRASKINNEKILEVTTKIIELLTREVPIRCQDVAVYLSMEEREYLEEHRELYKEAMMEEEPPLKTKDTSKVPGTSMDLQIHLVDSCKDPAMGVCKPKSNTISKVSKNSNFHRGAFTIIACSKSTQTEHDFGGEASSQPPPCKVGGDGLYSTAGESVIGFKTEVPVPSVGPDCAKNNLYLLPEQTQNTKAEDDTEAKEVTRHGQQSGGQPSAWQPTFENSHKDIRYQPEHFRDHSPMCSEDGPAPADPYAPSYGELEPHISARTSEEPKTIVFTNIYAPVDLTQEELSNIKQELVTWEEESRSFQEIYLPVKPIQDATAHPRGGGLTYHNSNPQFSTTHVKMEHEKDNVSAYEPQDQEQVDFMDIRIDDDGVGGLNPGNLNSQTLLNYVGQDENFNNGLGYGVPQMFNCPDCKRSFSSATTLAKHQLICRGRKPHVCSGCGKCFASASYLVIHERIHTGERPFSCSHCGKSFSRKPDLVRHERIHTGERPFACPDCGKRFTSVSNIFMHRRIHTGVKPFPCSQCGKRFIKKSDLVRHEKIHLPQRPVPCPECGRMFGSNHILNKHMLSHAGALHAAAQEGS